MVEPPLDVVGRGSAGPDGEGPPRRHWAGALLLAVLVGIVLLVRQHGPGDHPLPSPSTSASRSPSPAPSGSSADEQGSAPPLDAAVGAAVRGVPGAPQDVELTALGLYAAELDPARVLRIDPSTHRVLASAVAPANTGALTVDPAARRLWAWSTGLTGTAVFGYDAGSLRRLGQVHLPGSAVAGAGYAGRLYLGTAEGLFRWEPGRSGLQAVGGVRGPVYGVAVDRARGHVLAVTDRALSVVDPRTGKRLATRPLALQKPTLAVVGGRLWVGGFGGTGPRVLVLDAATLKPGPTPAAAGDVGPGAVVWAGDRVVWVRDGGSTALLCVDAATGAVDAGWSDVVGPVTSRRGAAYAVTRGEVHALDLAGGCAG